MDRDRPNGITALRFFLAAAVVVFHAWPLGEFGLDPVQVLTNGQARNGGSIAIMAFFGLSGYLLIQSRQRSNPVKFAWRRALRILPGYWISIIATVAVLVPTLLYYGGGWLQYGYRYALDSIPFVFALCGLAAVRDERIHDAVGLEGPGIGLGWRLLIVIGLVVGLGGVYWAYHL